MDAPLTKSRCPDCRRLVDARLLERDGRVHLAYECPEHGARESLLFKDAALHRALGRWHETDAALPMAGFSRDWSQFRRLTTTCTVDVTTRCNLRCPDCLAAAGGAGGGDEPSVEEILSWLPPRPASGFAPNLSLVGGESILRADLDQIVAGMVRRGFTPRLNSNGKALLDRALLTRLRRAGLRWIILQFDGFQPTTSVRFRGEDLVAHKERVIALLGELGFMIHFAVMVEAGVNDREIADILRFAVATPQVRRVSFYPRAQVGRSDAGGERHATDASDLVRALEAGTAGGVTRDDLLEFKRLWRLMFRVTGSPVFRNRRCLLPFMVRRGGRDIVPLNRLLKPGWSAERWRRLAGLAGELPRLWRFDRGDFADDILPVNIESLYATCAFDVNAAANCHQVYLTRQGFIHFCLYNSFFRGGARASAPE